MADAGPIISVHSRIASPYSQQIANGNAGPASDKTIILLTYLRCWSNVQTVGEHFFFRPQNVSGGTDFCSEGVIHK